MRIPDSSLLSLECPQEAIGVPDGALNASFKAKKMEQVPAFAEIETTQFAEHRLGAWIVVSGLLTCLSKK
jgi:hypothetical protein